MRAYSDRFTAALDSLCEQSTGSIQHSAVSEKERKMCWVESEGKGLTGQAQRRITGEGRGLDMEGQGKGLALSEVQVALLRRLVGLPRYIFSGVQQVITVQCTHHNYTTITINTVLLLQTKLSTPTLLLLVPQLLLQQQQLLPLLPQISVLILLLFLLCFTLTFTFFYFTIEYE